MGEFTSLLVDLLYSVKLCHVHVLSAAAQRPIYNMQARRQVLSSAQRLAGAVRPRTQITRVAGLQILRPATARLLPTITTHNYANGRPHPPGGTHRMDMGGGEEKPALEQYGVDLTARAKDGVRFKFSRDERRTTPSSSVMPVPARQPS